MTIYDLLQTSYQLVLAALTTCVLLLGTGQMRRTVMAVFAVMLIGWSLSGLWPTSNYALAMIAIDSAALVVITWRPAGKWQSIIGLSYILQVSVHVGRIASADNADINSYYWGLSITAILQLLLLWGWFINERVDRHHRRGRDHKAVASTCDQGMVR